MHGLVAVRLVDCEPADTLATMSDLTLSPDEMRALGYRVVDRVVEHLTTLGDQPAIQRSTRAETESRLREAMPRAPSDPESVLEQVDRDIFSSMAHVQHPRFFAFVPGPSNFISVLADTLVAGFNPFVGTWFAGSGPIQVELVVLDWLRQVCGLPESAGGLFVSGGSMANLTALAAARHARFGSHDARGPDASRSVVYFSDQTHSAVPRALRVLGFGEDQMCRVPSGADLRMPIDTLRNQIRQDRNAGKLPFCVIANAGTTNTGTVDPLPTLADLCQEQDLWLHADGAYGAAARLSSRGTELLDGLDRLDSLALDPHKWLFQPFEIGCVLVRDPAVLRNAFHVRPEYLRDIDFTGDELNLADHGVQLSRSFRALKLWMTFKVFGADALAKAIDRGIELAEFAESLLDASEAWEVVSPAQLGVVAFRHRFGGIEGEKADQLHARLVDTLVADGFGVATSTVLHGRTVLRLCTINPRTTDEDMRATIERLEELAGTL